MIPSYSRNCVNPHPLSFPNSRPTYIIRSTGSCSLPSGTLARENLALFPPSATAHPAQLPEHSFLPVDTARRLAPGISKAQALVSQASATQYSYSQPKTITNPYLSLVPHSPSLPSQDHDTRYSIVPFAGVEPEDPAEKVKRRESVRRIALGRLQHQREEQLAKRILFPSIPRREAQRPLREQEQRWEDEYQQKQLTRRISGEDWERRHYYPELAKKELKEQQEREREEEKKRLEEKRKRNAERSRKEFDDLTARELKRKGY
ncbi:hypothetical protein QBC41DRAFT_392849 [Cercophora samala]|uniref:Uncharacterized protein n=1 Tax=Cercophora samala TaxID=330535 RepID=A0AA40DGL1_9PEZI|nr:hypothetical protein QBC41DRAFT_392849 [Cercophora samala]